MYVFITETFFKTELTSDSIGLTLNSRRYNTISLLQCVLTYMCFCMCVVLSDTIVDSKWNKMFVIKIL